MGEVYEAIDTRLNRRVAIKVLGPDHAGDPVWRERFDREARAISALNHPHICTLYDIGHQDGIDFLVMEHCDGETLADRLARRPMRLDEVLRHAIELADALATAHRQGIVHRDLKPSNIMLVTTGGARQRSVEAKLLDFGIAKLRARGAPPHGEPITASGESGNLTAEGTLVGTLNYMAPEQLEGKDVDARTDIFALGAVLYEMVTGHRAFAGDSRASVIAAVLEHDPPAPRSILPLTPASLDRVVRKSLSKDPNQRWQTAQDLADELRWIGEADSHVASTSALDVARTRRRRVTWIAAGILLAAAVAVLARMALSSRPIDLAGVQFDVSPPAGSSFAESSAFLAVSPDGRSLAFAASNDGQRGLWLRPLDATAARHLEGTQGAGQPSWSPDSRFIAFWAGGKAGGSLRTIDLTDGTVQTLADAPMMQTGTWSSAGMILFNRSETSQTGSPRGFLDRRNRLYLASSNGIVAPVAGIDTARAWPSFLPDGHRFLYLGANEHADLDRGGTLYVGSLDSADRTALVESDSQGVFAAPNHLVYMRNNTLLAQSFDVASLRVTGDPLPIANMVERTPGSRRGAFSVSQTGVLAYRPVGGTELVWFDRDGKRLGTIGIAGRYGNPALSPDEHHLAVARFDPDRGTSDIWVIELARNVMSRFTFDPAQDDMPIWSPDGTRIVFKSTRGPSAGIYQKASNGTGAEELLMGGLTPFAATPMSWSPDGRTILFSTTGAAFHATAYLLPLRAPRTTARLFETELGMSLSCELSPDGRWAAFVSDESGKNEVYVRRFPSGDGKWQISVNGGLEPKWRNDGKELFYLAPDRSLMAVPVRAGVQFELGPASRLFQTLMSNVPTGGYTRNQYVVGANGQRFLINQTTGAAYPAPITVLVNWTARLRK
jgi:serine/threonine protein kinase/Tol biopolymer transport system component